VDFQTPFSQTIPILCFLKRATSFIKKSGSFLHIKHSLKYKIFSGNSQVKLNENLGLAGIYGWSSFSLFSNDFSLDFAQPALLQALNLSISLSSFSINSCSLLKFSSFFFSILSLSYKYQV
jgi:hypothetical protein